MITWNPVGSGTVDVGLTLGSPVTGSTYWARYEYVTRTASPWVGAAFKVSVLPDTVNESAPNAVPPTLTVVVVSFRTVLLSDIEVVLAPTVKVCVFVRVT